MNVNKGKEAITTIQKRLYEEGSNDAIIADWLALRDEFIEANLFMTSTIKSSWNFTGYLLFDRKSEFGLALHYRIEAMRAEAGDREPSIDQLFGVLVYASTSEVGLPVFLEYFDLILRRRSSVNRSESERIRIVASELMEGLESTTLKDSIGVRLQQFDGRV